MNQENKAIYCRIGKGVHNYGDPRLRTTLRPPLVTTVQSSHKEFVQLANGYPTTTIWARAVCTTHEAYVSTIYRSGTCTAQCTLNQACNYVDVDVLSLVSDL